MKKYPILVLVFLLAAVYWQFFIFGRIPLPADTLVGAYFPWLDYKWGNEVGVAVKNPPLSDAFSQFYLWKYLGLEFLKQGQFPLWNPYSSSGTPFLATYHSSPLLPFNLILLLPKSIGWGLFIFAQTLFAALGMYFLLGFYIKNPISKIAGSFVFSLSGLMVTWVEFGTGVWAAAALPWIFYGLLGFYKTKKYRYLSLFSVAFTWLFLAGHAQLTLYSSLLFLIFSFVNFFKDKSFKNAFITLLFFVISVTSSLLVLLPAYDFSNDSIRKAESYASTFGYGLSAWYEFIRLFAADFFGNPTTYNHWDKVASYHEQSSFLGTIVVALILSLFFLRKNKDFPLFWIATFLVSLFLALENPVTKFIYSQPFPLLTYSSASRVLFITSLCAGILVGYSLEKIILENDFKKRIRFSSLFLIACLVFGLISVYLTQPQNELAFSVSTRNTLLPIILLLSFVALTFLRFTKKLFVLIVVGLIFFDLGRYFLKYNPFVPIEYVFPKTSLTDFLSQKNDLFRIARLDQKILPPNTWAAYGLSSVEGYDPLSLENYAKYFNLVNGNKYSDSVSRYIETKRPPNNFLNALNAKYILITKEDFQKMSTPSASLTNVFEDKNSIVLENPNAMPRAYFAEKVLVFDQKYKLENTFNDPSFNATRNALVIHDSTINAGLGEVKSVKYYPNEIKIEAESKTGGFLVLAESYHKDWGVTINGEKSRVLEVNGALQGVSLPAGTSIIEFKYWPKSFDIGLKLSIIGIGMFLITNLYLVLKRRW